MRLPCKKITKRKIIIRILFVRFQFLIYKRMKIQGCIQFIHEKGGGFPLRELEQGRIQKSGEGGGRKRDNLGFSGY